MEERLIKRPMLMIAGGFVLGEVLILLHMLTVGQAAAGLFMPVVLLLPRKLGLIRGCDGLRRSRSAFWRLLLFSLAFFAGAVRTGAERRLADEGRAAVRAFTYAEAAGTVGRITNQGEMVTVELQAVTLSDPAPVSHGNEQKYPTAAGVRKYQLQGLLISADPELMPDSLKLGMRLTAEGRLEEFPAARNPGEFDSRDYYLGQRLNGRMTAAKLSAPDPEYDRLSDGLRRLRQWGGAQLRALVSGPEAGIFQAAVLGDKDELDPAIRELYARNGISHLLALSGLHLSLIASGCYRLLRKGGAGFLGAGTAGAVVAFAYVLMTGSPVSVIRSAVMLVCGFIAAGCGRRYDLLSAMGLAGVVLLFHNPYFLIQSGFQLSFGAIAGIGFVSPCLSGGAGDETAARPGRAGAASGALRPGGVAIQALGVSLAVQAVTLPITLWHFYQTSMYGLILNLIVIPLMAFVILSGLAAIFLGALNAGAGRFAVGAGYWVLLFYERLCMAAERLPFAVRVTGRPAVWQMIAYSIVLAVLLVRWGRREGAAGRRILALMCLSGLLLLRFPVAGLHVTFLDVGQGDGIYLRTKDTAILVDGGSSDIRSLGKYRLEPFLKHQGDTRIDYVIVSHGDSDHISGIRYLLAETEEIRIGTLILPAAGMGMEVYGELSLLAAQREVPVRWFGAGDYLSAGPLRLTCLYPERAEHIPDTNRHSLVIKADYLDFHLLLTGDMGTGEEQQLLSEAGVRSQLPMVQVLKAAHHGSRFSTSGEWLDVLRPEWAVISAGANNTYGHPHPEVLERLDEQGITVFQTALGGAVILETDGSRIRWREWAVR